MGPNSPRALYPSLRPLLLSPRRGPSQCGNPHVCAIGLLCRDPTVPLGRGQAGWGRHLPVAGATPRWGSVALTHHRGQPGASDVGLEDVNCLSLEAFSLTPLRSDKSVASGTFAGPLEKGRFQMWNLQKEPGPPSSHPLSPRALRRLFGQLNYNEDRRAGGPGLPLRTMPRVPGVCSQEGSSPRVRPRAGAGHGHVAPGSRKEQDEKGGTGESPGPDRTPSL